MKNGHKAVLSDGRMVMWLWYRKVVWSRGCGNGLENGHVAGVPDRRMVTWLLQRTGEWSLGCGIGL